MKRTVRRVPTDATAHCIGDGTSDERCGWVRTYIGPRSPRTAREAAARHLQRTGHGSYITQMSERIYSFWPSKNDIRAWGLSEFEESP